VVVCRQKWPSASKFNSNNSTRQMLQVVCDPSHLMRKRTSMSIAKSSCKDRIILEIDTRNAISGGSRTIKRIRQSIKKNPNPLEGVYTRSSLKLSSVKVFPVCVEFDGAQLVCVGGDVRLIGRKEYLDFETCGGDRVRSNLMSQIN
jgi:hypothetical protein